MGMFKESELKILWPFYIDLFFSRILHFAAAFLVVYFIGLGFSAFQIGMLIAVMPLTALLFEIPTGAVADIYGRKFSVLLGYALEGVGYLLLFFTQDFYSVLFVFALIGFGTTFSSGSKEAWITDLIKGKNKKFLHDYFVKRSSFTNLGLFLSGLLGALIVKQFGLPIIWVFAFSSFLLSIIILLFAEEIYKKRKVHAKQSFKELNKQVKTSINYSRKHHVLFYFLMAVFIFEFAFAFNESLSWTPFLQSFGFPDHAFGYLWSALALAMAISPWAAKKFLAKGKERKFIISVVSISALITLLVLFVQNISFALLVTVASIFFYTMRIPPERVYFHRFIPSKLRATIGSIETMILSIASIISIPLVGLLIDAIGARLTIFLSGILMIPGIIIFYKIKDAKK